MTYWEWQKNAAYLLTAAGIEDAETEARLLVMQVGKMDGLMAYFDRKNQPVSEGERALLDEMLEKRQSHVPLQYLFGEQEFYGLPFFVDESVLIPRPETELLLEAVLKESEGKRVLDLCTGSGCLAIGTAKLGKPAFVAASDLSEAALDTAKRNAKRNDVSITFFQGDLFENVIGSYDIIVSNPPYIKKEDMRQLMPEVREHEPMMALCGGEDGLDFYRRIATEAKPFLKEGGRLMMEIGYDQGEALLQLLTAQGYHEVEIRKDYAGLDRMAFAKWKGKETGENHV